MLTADFVAPDQPRRHPWIRPQHPHEINLDSLAWSHSCTLEHKTGKSLFKEVSRAVRPEDGVVTCFRNGEVTLRTNRRITGFTESEQEIGYHGVRIGDLVIHQMDAFAGPLAYPIQTENVRQYASFVAK